MATTEMNCLNSGGSQMSLIDATTSDNIHWEATYPDSPFLLFFIKLRSPYSHSLYIVDLDNQTCKKSTCSTNDGEWTPNWVSLTSVGLNGTWTRTSLNMYVSTGWNDCSDVQVIPLQECPSAFV